ncbi:MAG: response regulator [Alphaproteobacteria bacterium]|nr:response regulator [Alphaproteobacteria bacterium]
MNNIDSSDEMQEQAHFPAGDVRSEMNLVAQNYMRVAGLALAIYYGLRSIAYMTRFPADVGPLLATGAVAATVFGLFIFLTLRRRVFGPSETTVATLLLGLFVIFNVFWNMYLTGNKNQFFSAGLAIIVFGIVTTQWRIWLALVAVCLGCYLYALPHMDVILIDVLSVPLACTLLSAAAFFTRAPAIQKRVELQLQLEGRAENLEVTNKAKDRFLANMTHDLRTPMTGVVGMMDLLRETPLTKEQSDLLSMAKKSAGYLLAIINDVLDYSKLGSGKFELKPEPMDAAAVTRDMAEMIRSQALAKSLSLTVHLPEQKIVPVVGDSVRVGQILFNLLGNAVKFTERGEIGLSLTCWDGPGGHYLEWVVSDTGEGIPASKINRLFQRFEQLDQSATRNQAGTGLGLSIIKELTTLMGGDVQVSSEVGKGSRFTVAIPFERADPAEVAARQTQKEVTLPTVGADGRAPRILVAEDNLINRVVIQKVLAKQDWSADFVENGEAAVEAVLGSAEPYDLILMDIQMPVMDGVSATKAILAKTKSPPPIVALTANTMKEDVTTYLQAGMAAHIGKPIDTREMMATIAKVLAP